MQGLVVDVDSREPVAGAIIQVLIESETDPALRLRQAKSDDLGRYSIELPAGHAAAWTPTPPAGYYPIHDNDLARFASTAESPVFRKDYEFRKGAIVRLQYRLPNQKPIGPGTYAGLSGRGDSREFRGSCELDTAGRGTITLPELRGRFAITCGEVLTGMSVDYEPKFDPFAVVDEIDRDDRGNLTIRDSQGRRAILQGCDALINNQELTIVVHGEKRPQHVIVGRVVDTGGNALEEAGVRIVVQSGSVRVATQVAVSTDAVGQFSISIPAIDDKSKVFLTVTHNAHAGVDSVTTDPTISNGRVDIGTITLEKGCSLRVRVVGPGGTPLHGAVVEPVNDFASRTRVVRTGPDGECELTHLSAGMQRIFVQFGNMNAQNTVPTDSNQDELVVIRLAARDSATQPVDTPAALEKGVPAPEWSIAEWSDENSRQLSDYRGKTVVLVCWGAWCGSCVHQIPAIKQLQQRYRDRDVVFLSVHTAGTDMSLIRRYLKAYEWEILVGLDSGMDQSRGITVNRYAIRGFPTVMVIDAQGRISFNGQFGDDHETILREMQAAAESIGLSWPIDTDATREQISERLAAICLALYDREIEAALGMTR